MSHWQPDDLNYAVYGNKQQPAILFLHGFMGSGDDYAEICRELEHKFYCLTVDLPGHGKTRRKKSQEYYTMSRTAQGLIDLLDRLQIDQCFLAGYSMGGRLALYLTLHYPSRFCQAILESASPGLKTAQERSQRRQADEKIAQKLVTIPFKDFLLEWYSQKLFNSLNRHPKFQQLIECRMQQKPRQLAKSLRYMGTGNQPSLWEQLLENTVPLLLLVGEYDRKFTAINTEIANRCPLAELEIIPRTGHNIHFEDRDNYLIQLIKFLGRSSDRIESC